MELRFIHFKERVRRFHARREQGEETARRRSARRGGRAIARFISGFVSGFGGASASASRSGGESRGAALVLRRDQRARRPGPRRCENELHAAVEAVLRARRVRNERRALAIADDTDIDIADAARLKRVRRRLGAALGEGLVVFRRAAIVRMACNDEDGVVVGLQLFGDSLDRRFAFSAQARGVEVEERPPREDDAEERAAVQHVRRQQRAHVRRLEEREVHLLSQPVDPRAARFRGALVRSAEVGEIDRVRRVGLLSRRRRDRCDGNE